MLYSFEDFLLDTARRELRRGGAVIALQPQVFDLLEYSIRNRERVVSKDDLLAAVWHGRIVSELTLSTRINAARSAIGDSGEEQRLIRTAHGKGIRFVGAVREGNNSAEIRRSGALPEEATGLACRRPEPISEERRQLTVMYCNLVESTGLASRLDPEDLRDLTSTYHRAITEIVTRFEGFVAKHLRDGVLIYFGYPRAREDDAERAIRCALTVADTVTRLELDEELRTSVGIATSMVVIGDPIDSGGSGERSIVGEAPSLAARLQHLAAPNSVLIAESTRRLVGELFEYQAVEVKGIGAPGAGLAGVAPKCRRESFRGIARIGADPAGRPRGGDRPVAAPLGAREDGGWPGRAGLRRTRPRQVAHHRGIGGAPPRRAASPPALFLLALSPGQRAVSVYRPARPGSGVRARGHARGQAGEARSVAGPRRAAGRGYGIPRRSAVIAGSERHPLPNFSPQRKKERTLEALIRQLEGLARRQPVVMVFEDAHWIDPTSRELLDLTVERVRTLPVLLIVTFRPEFQPPWTGQPQVTTLALNRLDRRDRIALVAQIAGGKTLPDDVIGQIVDRTDGVPLVCRGIDQERAGERSAARGGGSLCARRRVAAIRDPDDPARLADGAARSLAVGAAWWRRSAP